jgi:hypothetical protein
MRRELAFKLHQDYIILLAIIGTYWCVRSSNHSFEMLEWVYQAETVDKKFERPLRQHLETYRTIVAVRAEQMNYTLLMAILG